MIGRAGNARSWCHFLLSPKHLLCDSVIENPGIITTSLTQILLGARRAQVMGSDLATLRNVFSFAKRSESKDLRTFGSLRYNTTTHTFVDHSPDTLLVGRTTSLVDITRNNISCLSDEAKQTNIFISGSDQHLRLNNWFLGNSEFCFPRISMFPEVEGNTKFEGNKILCSPRDQLLSDLLYSKTKQKQILKNALRLQRQH